ncbi:MAG: NUDIX domain-containing protein [Bacteroidetes bacterium]|nr:NUDIX domain-containing protein [Bacteroidota bacterium]
MLKVTCAIIISNNRILVTQNNAASDHPFLWEFPGGKIKPGEYAADCIEREILEELEIEIKILKGLTSIIFDYGFKKIELIPFLCSIKKGKIELNEHNDFNWLKFEELETVDFSGADLKLIQLKDNCDILKEYVRK